MKKNKQKTYSKEDWFVPINNRVFTDGVSEQITLVENERGDKISLNQESSLSTESSDIDSYIDTPLLLKEDNSQDNDKEMTADDLTNDKEKAEEVKEEFEDKEEDTTDNENNDTETVDDNTGDDSTDSDNDSNSDNGDSDTTDTTNDDVDSNDSKEDKEDTSEDKDSDNQSLEGYKSIKDVFSNMNIF